MRLLRRWRRWLDGALVHVRRAASTPRAHRESRSTPLAADPREIRVGVPAIYARIRARLAPAPEADRLPGVPPGASNDRAADPEQDATCGEFAEFTFSCHAGARRYKLFLPPMPASRSIPLVVMLHGCKQTPDDFALGTRMNEFARREAFAVAYPAQSRRYNSSKCWNWFRPADQVRGTGEPEIIAGLTRYLVTRHGLDRDRVYVVGLSAGGAMAAILGEAYPDLYAAVGIHSGVPHGVAVGVVSGLALMQHGRADSADAGGAGSGSASTSGLPVIVFHGDADATVHPRNATEVYARSARHSHADIPSSDSDLAESIESGFVPGGHAFTRTRWLGENRVATAEFWLVHGSGHAWSGGDARGSFTDPRGPDASGAMLRFFFAHRLKHA